MGKLRNRVAQIYQILRGIKGALKFVWAGSPFWMIFNSILQLLQGVMPILLLLLLKLMVDEVTFAATGQTEYARILTIIILTGLVTLFSYLMGTLSGWGNREQGRLVSDHMAGILLEKAGDLDYQFFENAKDLDSLHRAQEQASSRPRQIVQAMSSIIQNLVSLSGVIWIIFRFHPLIVLVLFIAALPGMVNRMFFSTREYLNERQCTQKERRSFYYQYMMLERSYAKEVRLFHLVKTILERYRQGRKELRKIRHDLDVKQTIYSSISSLFMVVFIFAAYAWVAQDVITGQVTVGAFVMFYQAFQRGQGFLRGFLNGFASLYSHNLFLQNLYAFLDIQPRIVSPEKLEEMEKPVKGNIFFDEVSFSYPNTDKKILDNLSLTINEGEVVALVGLNGCGKTTLVKLLCRLYEVDEGVINLDGHDIRRLSLGDLRETIGVIFQDFVKYNLTLNENIRFGDMSVPFNRECMEDAVKMAGAEDLVASLPSEYDTILGVLFEQGQELSGGQWQKVAMARAFYKDSGIVVLDEPTSALDPKAEFEVYSRFKSIFKNRSALLISHRMTTVRMADRICVMDKGAIVEEGTHDELLGKKGLYHELFNLQAENYR